MPTRPHAIRLLALAALLVVAGAACAAGQAAPGARSATVRLAYLPNLTHATAIAGVVDGDFSRRLLPDRLEARTFGAGPAVVEALFAGAIDVAYLGPNPAINAYVRSQGEAVRVLAGATTGGAGLVVSPDITTVGRLRGARLATPQLGGSQDIALRWWLREHGLGTEIDGGGDVTVAPLGNAEALEAFRLGAIDGAWVPEPWVTRLLHAGGRLLLDEREVWPGGDFASTVLVARASFVRDHPATVRRLVDAHVAVTRRLRADPDLAQATLIRGIARITGTTLPADLVREAWARLELDDDPLLPALRESARRAAAVGLLPRVDVDGLADLRFLEAARRALPREEAA